MKSRDRANLLNRAAAALELYTNADALKVRQNRLTTVEVQELIEDLLVAAEEERTS